MNRRDAIKSALAGIAACLWPWKAKASIAAEQPTVED